MNTRQRQENHIPLLQTILPLMSALGDFKGRLLRDAADGETVELEAQGFGEGGVEECRCEAAG